MKNKYLQLLICIAAFLILSLVIFTSYAYFVANVNGSAFDTVITTGDMRLAIEDGSQVSLVNAIPGDSVTKTFRVTNIGTVETTYDVYMSELINTFEDPNDLIYSLESVNGCSKAETVVPSEGGKQAKIVQSCIIEPSHYHDYTLTLTFKEDGTNQDDNKGKKFKSNLSVNEYKDAVRIAELIDGPTFNKLIKQTAGINSNNNTISNDTIEELDNMFDVYRNYTNEEYKSTYFSYMKIPKSLFDYGNGYNWSIFAKDTSEFQNDGNEYNINIVKNMPVGESFTHLESADSDYPILAWFEDDTVYIYCESDEIYLNENSNYMFSGMSLNNSNLAGLNGINAKNLTAMFFYSIWENPNLELFNFSSVTDTTCMFSYFFANQIDLSNVFNNSIINNMYGMFMYSSASSVIVDNMDTSNVVDMSYLFGDFKGNSITFGENFDTSNATNMSHMFDDYDGTTLDLSSFNTSKVTDMSYMFYFNSSLTSINFGNNFDTSNVKDMSHIFDNVSSITELVLPDTFNTSNVTNMSYMFADMNELTNLDLGENFDTSNVTNMSNMFGSDLNNGLYKITHIDLGNNFDTSSVTNMSHMFSGAKLLESLNLGSKFNTSNVTKMDSMFWYCKSLKVLDLSTFDTSKVTDMGFMFGYMDSLTTIVVKEDWDLSNVEDSKNMFKECPNLVGGSGTTYTSYKTNYDYARIDDPEHGNPGYFTLKTN